tara:strand:- start:2328 stop:2771 length:444 start_codon:yes stop_codon:yes gene_type:complete
MKVILTTNIKKLGNMGDLVEVKDGFARNHLFPNNLALRNNKKNKDYYEKIKNEISEKEMEKKQNAIELIKRIKELDFIFSKESDEKGQLYGSISKKEILNFLNINNIKIHSDDILIRNPIRSIGDHEIEINPYIDLKETILIKVKKN